LWLFVVIITKYAGHAQGMHVPLHRLLAAFARRQPASVHEQMLMFNAFTGRTRRFSPAARMQP
jgi:hypothetical protein